MIHAKALIFPSRWYETMGLTVLEAQAIGIPCIVYRKTAASEFVDNDELKFNDIKELEQKILKLETEKMISNKIDLKKFNESTYVDDIIKLLNKLK